MTRRLRIFLTAALLAGTLAPAAVRAQQEDPYLWLENVEGDSALAWVRSQDSTTLAELQSDTVYRPIYERTLRILQSRDRIPSPSMLGNAVYNFWQDENHPRGIWRRTSWESYVSGSPEWQTVLDVDSLAKAEGVAWSWGGADCLEPEYRRCLVSLSRGGSDAAEVREFDTGSRRFVPDGFRLPEAKSSVAWYGPDSVFVGTDFGPGSLTTSGYPRIVKVWGRGTPLSSARTLFEGDSTDVAVGGVTVHSGGRIYHLLQRVPTIFEAEYYILRDGRPVRLDIPLDADPNLVGDRFVVYLRSDWNAGGSSYPAGSLVSTSTDDFLSGGRDFTVVYSPDERSSVEGVSRTRDHLLVQALRNVRPLLLRYRYAGGTWSADTVPVPDFGSVRVVATSPESDRFFFTFSGFTQPTTLYAMSADGTRREVRRLPAMFDAEGLVTDQHEATSKDGTRVPYFVVHRRDMPLDGENPTLQYGYGGFEISMTPNYLASWGADWLERGGVYVLANIRGGGEFGPSWHRAALKEHRQRAYDDFIAVAEDLVKRGITSPAHLGIEGGSNGGLLMGVMLTERPDLFGAIAILNPLLDMKRYNHLLAGASWMGEYGNPDIPEEWAYISKYSPYQNVSASADYPPVFIATTTRDDRVHPGHARKMAAKLEAMGHPVWFFENTEGGHGAGVTPAQQAREQALIFTYLWRMLR